MRTAEAETVEPPVESKLAQEKQASLPAGGTCIVVLRLESYVVLLCADM